MNAITSSSKSAVRFTLNFFEKTITGTKASFNKANKGYGPEYEELTAKMAAHPTFKVIEKEPNTKKNTYEGLDFPMMQNYINTLPNAEEMMAEFIAVKEMAGGKYPLVKKWFLDTFKGDANTFKVSEAKKQIATAKVNRVKATVKLVSVKKSDEAAA